MGVNCCRFFLNKSRCGKKQKRKILTFPVAAEEDLSRAQNSCNRYRLCLSAIPINPPIKEEKLLESLCNKTDIEPKVGADGMRKQQKKQMEKDLMKKIPKSKNWFGKYPSEDDYEQFLRKSGTEKPSATLHKKM